MWSIVAYLIIHSPNAPRQRVMLGEKAVIGRSFGSDVWFDDPRLSRRHAIIEREGECWVLVDQKSTNGTYVNSKPIDRHLLVEGDSIEIGKTRIEFMHGRFMESRPTDPIDAAIQAPGNAPITPADGTVAGDSIHRRQLPIPQPYLVHTGFRDMPSVPLPFTRPPAKPIVPDIDQAPAAERWMVSIMHKLRGE